MLSVIKFCFYLIKTNDSVFTFRLKLLNSNSFNDGYLVVFCILFGRLLLNAGDLSMSCESNESRVIHVLMFFQP